MKKRTLLLIIIAILIIGIVCIEGYLMKKPEEPIVVETSVGGEIKEVTDRNIYYMVKNCVKKYYTYYGTMFNTREDDDIEKTYSLFDKNYINYKGITQENMLTLLPRRGDVSVSISNMLESKQTETISVYIVEGILREELTNELTDFQIMIQVDTKSGAFSVFLQDYIETKFKNRISGEVLKMENLLYLEATRYNRYLLEEITDQEYAISLFNDYKEKVLYNQELAYEHLDSEYSSIKFPTVGSFKEYIESRKAQYTEMKIQKYKKTQEDFTTQYVCVDNNGYYYIFQEIGLMKYRITLDTYTIDLPEFLEKYNSSNTIRKVGYNIQKCLDAINYQDYKYVYNKLDLEFKALNYPLLEDFEKEIKSKLFVRNKVKKVESFYEGNTHIYKMTITDVETEKKAQNMTVVMQLKEGTDFVMSFSFQ